MKCNIVYSLKVPEHTSSALKWCSKITNVKSESDIFRQVTGLAVWTVEGGGQYEGCGCWFTRGGWMYKVLVKSALSIIHCRTYSCVGRSLVRFSK